MNVRGLRLARVALAVLAVWSLTVATAPAGEAATGNSARVVTLAPHLAELVHAIGAGDQLVGVSRFADYPPAVRTLPDVGDAFAINEELLVTLAPTVVLTWQGGTPAAVDDRLRRLGLAIYPVAIRRLDDVAAAMRDLGRRLDVTETADAAAARFSRQIAALRTPRDPPVRVFYQVSAMPVYTLNDDHVASDVIRLCGGVNVFADMDAIAPQLSREAVITARPEAIIASSPAGVDAWRGKTAARAIPAVADGHVWVIEPDWLTRPGPRLVDGARAVCQRLESVRPATAPRPDSPAGTGDGRSRTADPTSG